MSTPGPCFDASDGALQAAWHEDDQSPLLLPDAQMDPLGLRIDKLLRLEAYLEELPPGNERSAKTNLLKYLQVNAVREYETVSTHLYINLRGDKGFDQLQWVEEKQGPEGGLVQPLEAGSIEDYLQQANCAKLYLDKLLGSVAPAGTPGREAVRAPVKSLERTRVKAEVRGGIHKVTDMARATVICDTPHDLVDVFDSLVCQVSKVTWRVGRQSFSVLRDPFYLAVSSRVCCRRREQVDKFLSKREECRWICLPVCINMRIFQNTHATFPLRVISNRFCVGRESGERYFKSAQRLHSRLREQWLQGREGVYHRGRAHLRDPDTPPTLLLPERGPT